MDKSAKALREERADVLAEAKKLQDKLVTENRDAFSDDETKQFDNLTSKAEDLLKRAETRERLETFNASLKSAVHVGSVSSSLRKPSKSERNNAIRGVLLQGTNFQRPEYRDAAESLGLVGNVFNVELRDQSTDQSGEGEDLLNGSIFQGINTALKAHGGIREVATVIRTESGSPIHFATNNDTSNVGAVVAELVERTNTSLAFDRVTLNSFTYVSNCFPVSLELIQDAQIDISSYIGRALGERLARGTNADYTTANGSGKATGFLYSSTQGALSDSSSTFATDDIWDLYGSVDVAYRNSPSCVWMMHDSVANMLRKMEADDGYGLWGNGFNGSPSDTLCGKRVIINNNMPTVSAGAKVIAFGDFSHFYIRDVKDVTVEVERNPRYGAVNFYASLRTDSKLVDAGTHPIKHLALAAGGSGG